MAEMPQLSVEIDANTKAEMEDIKAVEGISIAFQVRYALKLYLESKRRNMDAIPKATAR